MADDKTTPAGTTPTDELADEKLANVSGGAMAPGPVAEEQDRILEVTNQQPVQIHADTLTATHAKKKASSEESVGDVGFR